MKVNTWLLAYSINYSTPISVCPGSTTQVCFCINKLRLRAQVKALVGGLGFLYHSKKVKQTIRHISVIHGVK